MTSTLPLPGVVPKSVPVAPLNNDMPCCPIDQVFKRNVLFFLNTNELVIIVSCFALCIHFRFYIYIFILFMLCIYIC